MYDTIGAAPRTHGKGETRKQTLLRLGHKAVGEGIQGWARDGVVYVTSASRPEALYRVCASEDGTQAHCECQGWAKFGYCKHYAYALGLLGYLDGADPGTTPAVDDDPDPAAECAGCGARARLYATGRCDECEDRAVWEAMQRGRARASEANARAERRARQTA